MKRANLFFKLITVIGLIAGIVFFNSAQARSPFASPSQSTRFSSYLSRKQNVPTISVSTEKAQAAIETVTPAVVSIFGYKNSPPQEEDQTIFLPFFNISITIPTQTETQVDAGTGFFVDSRGYILTSEHVVADTEATYKIVQHDGTETEATVVYRDSQNDIALLKIPGQNYPVVTLGDSSNVKVGNIVLGTGNALGSVQPVPVIGYVTALNQTINPSNTESDQQTIGNLFRSSMQLYPGHSGGPTFDLEGNVVGINDAIASNVRNVSFSVPINEAKDILKQIIQ